MSSLESQVIKIFRHARQGSIETSGSTGNACFGLPGGSCNFSHAELKELKQQACRSVCEAFIGRRLWQPI